MIFRLTQCTVSHVDDSGTVHPVHTAHSFKDDTLCFDDRLNFVQTQFTPNVAFTMRTFRFNIDGSGDSTSFQQQAIACSLHLDATSNVGHDQAAACDCYSQSDCQADPTDPASFNLPTEYTYDNSCGGSPIFYRIYPQRMTYEAGTLLCSNDGGTLPVRTPL